MSGLSLPTNQKLDSYASFATEWSISGSRHFSLANVAFSLAVSQLRSHDESIWTRGCCIRTSPSLLTIHFSSGAGEGVAFRIEQQEAVRKLRVAESVEQEMSIYPDDEKSMRLLEFAQDDDEVKSGQSDSSADEEMTLAQTTMVICLASLPVMKAAGFAVLVHHRKRPFRRHLTVRLHPAHICIASDRL